ncbi:hypothetical protein AX15_006103 [Amanita polypyramis BW_CC]|nr:hypothetical protein AX15_006103 [Amanita polypyramis BW_CC]
MASYITSYSPKPRRASWAFFFPHGYDRDGMIPSGTTTTTTTTTATTIAASSRSTSQTSFQFKSPTPVLFAKSPTTAPGSESDRNSCAAPDGGGTGSNILWKGKGKKHGEEGGGRLPGGPSPPTTPPRPGLGYFAFPAGSPPPSVFLATDSDRTSKSPPPQFDDPTCPSKSTELKSPPRKTRAPSHANSRLRELERVEAERGEEEWVACGGVLRDRYGNVDEVRTGKVREEVERKRRERELKERWDVYDEAWRALVERCRSGVANGMGKGKGKGKEKTEAGAEANERKDEDVVKDRDVGFGDIPWPVWIEDKEREAKNKKLVMSLSLRPSHTQKNNPCTLPNANATSLTTPDQLSITLVQDFLLAPLSVRGCTTTPKARIRSSLLRWHPDKLGWLLEKVKVEDVEDVKRGVGVVVECLQRMFAACQSGGGGVVGIGIGTEAGMR